ncbi:MAG TPA: HIT family protein [Pyrinomonadaceae bacterium]|nr:HIT family protein [Pyrinomonadaceae bacterium]
MAVEKNCIFCKILAGESEVSLVYRDETCAAFMDVQPVNPGHLLVMPVRHAAYLADLEGEEGAQIFRAAQRLTAALRRSGLKCEGVNLFLADGEAAMQEVFHVHLHVFPRFGGDGFGLKFPQGYFRKPQREELDEAAEKIKRALEEK